MFFLKSVSLANLSQQALIITTLSSTLSMLTYALQLPFSLAQAAHADLGAPFQVDIPALKAL